MLLLAACSQRVHKGFKANRYVNDYSLHIVNDPLQLYLKTPQDINNIKDKKKLSRILKHKEKTYRNVLLYGKTDMDPPYEYFLILDNPTLLSESINENTFVLDTTISNHKVNLIGKNLGKDTISYKKDMRYIFSSIRIGSNYRKDISTVNDVVSRYMRSNGFIQAYKDIKNFPAYDKQEAWLKLQMQLTFASFLDNQNEYDELLREFEPEASQDSISQIIKQNLISEAKVHEKIIAEAKQTNLVMINENHFMPQHRIFVYNLLSELKDNGYKYFALETLNGQQDSLLNLKEGFPTLETGFYTREQNYGKLIRYAKALGFEFVAYESDDSMEREMGQAQNLYKKTFGIDKNAKVLLLGGIDHILEEPTAKGKKWLGTVLKEKYNINPLTISQTHLNSYRRFSKDRIALVDGKLFKDRLQSVDYHLLNNIPRSNLNKQDANFTYKNQHPFPVQLTLFLATEIEHENIYQNNIPYHAIYLKPNEKVSLKLPEKSIYLYLFDANGKKVENELMNVTSKMSK